MRKSILRKLSQSFQLSFILLTIMGLNFSTASAAAIGDVIVNEFQANPVVVSDANGEWIELRNTTSSPVDLTGWVLDDSTPITLGTDGTVLTSLIIYPYSQYTICVNGDSSQNGGVVCDYEDPTMGLANGGDTITITSPSAVLNDSVTYTSSTPGSSTEVIHDNSGTITSLVENSTTPYGTGSNTGTPGIVNISTPVTNTRTNELFTGLQEAIDSPGTINGDTLKITNNFKVAEQVQINKEISIDGNGFTIYPTFTKTSDSNNSSLGIFAANVTIQNLTIDGTDGTNLHGIHAYLSDNTYLDNVKLLNNDHSGLLVNGASVTVNNITTAGNGWHGINVDQGSGVTKQSLLTITGHSSQTDTAQIYVDDTTKNVVVNDTLPQYTFVHVGAQPFDRLYTLDLTAPSIPVLTSPVGYINNNTPLMQWDDSIDNLALAGYYYRVYYNCSDNSNIPNSCSSLYPNTTGLWRTASEYQAGSTNDGEYFWQVKAEDTAGNLSNWSELTKVVIDTTNPTVPAIIAPTTDQYFNSQPILDDWTDSTDINGIDHYQIEYVYDDGHTFSGAPYRETPGTQSWRNHTPGPSEQGGVTIRVRAYDTAGNISNWSNTRHYIYDSVAPGQVNGLTIFKGTNTFGTNLGCSGYTNDRSITVDWNDSTDANFDFYRYITKSGWNTTLTNSQRSGLISNADGLYKYRVQAVDKANNTGVYSDWCYVTLDRQAPVVDIITPSDSDTLRNTVNIKGTITDSNNDHYWFVVQDSSGTTVAGPGTVYNSNSNILASFSWDTTLLPGGDGEYTIKLEARDSANNKDAGSIKWITVKVDNTPPTLTLTAPENGAVLSGIINLQATCNETCDYTNFWWRKDGNPYSNTSPEKNYHYIHTNGTTFDWSLDSLNAMRWGGDPSYAMSDGTYYFYAAAKDLAGNWNRTPEISVVIDNTAPEIVNAGSDEGAQSSTFSHTGTASDGSGSGIASTLWSQTSGPGTISASSLTNLTTTFSADVAGTYTVRLTATDQAGNSAFDEFTFMWTIPAVEGANITVTPPIPPTPLPPAVTPPTPALPTPTTPLPPTVTPATPPAVANVLGKETTVPSNKNQASVLADNNQTQTNDNSKNNTSLKIFSIYWYWWLLILAILSGFGYYRYKQRPGDSDEKPQN